MTWFKVDDQLAFHPKALAAGNAALGLWVRAGSWCGAHLTDGWLPAGMVLTLGGHTRDARKLVEVGLWCQESGGYRFRDWGHYQPTKAEVEAEREASRKRQAAFRERKRHGVSNGVTTPVSNGVGSPAPSRPDPTTSKEPPVVPHDDSEKPKPKTTGRKRPSTKKPDGWKPNDKHLEIAKEQGVSPSVELAKFIDYTEANDKRYVDWDAAFRNWLRNARPSNVHQLPGKQPPSPWDTAPRYDANGRVQ